MKSVYDIRGMWSDHMEADMEIGIIEAPTVKELFVQRMTNMIIKGDLKPGDRLPSERAQSRISRSAVHLALVDLERMGFVETNARHGTYVCDFARKGNIETMNVLLRSSGGSFGTAKTKDMLEMRMAIEGKAMERLADNWNDEAEKELSQDVAKAQELVDGGSDAHTLARAFFDFHHDICFLSGNFILPLIFNSFEYATIAYWEEAIRVMGNKRCMDLMKECLGILRKQDSSLSLSFLQKEFDLFMKDVRKK